VAVPGFESDTVWAAPTLPTDILPKFKLLTDREAPGTVLAPVPVSATDCGELAIESVMINVALRGPVAVGKNVTDIVQLAFTAREFPQVVAGVLNSAVLTPEMEIPRIDRAAEPPLDRVKIEGALVVPTFTAPKETAAGLMAICGTAPVAPVPLREMYSLDCKTELSEIVSVPVLPPPAVGTYVIAIRHDAPAAIGAGVEQSVKPEACCENPAVSPIVAKVSGRLPTFNAVIGNGVLFCPTFTVPKEVGCGMGLTSTTVLLGALET
jgi:hypothetical protein